MERSQRQIEAGLKRLKRLKSLKSLKRLESLTGLKRSACRRPFAQTARLKQHAPRAAILVVVQHPRYALLRPRFPCWRRECGAPIRRDRQVQSSCSRSRTCIAQSKIGKSCDWNTHITLTEERRLKSAWFTLDGSKWLWWLWRASVQLSFKMRSPAKSTYFGRFGVGLQTLE